MRRRDFEKKVNNHNEYNKCKFLIKQSKTTFYKETIDKCKNDPRELVKCFNELGVKNVNRERISKIKHNEVITENIADIVNLFNYNFVNIGANILLFFHKQIIHFVQLNSSNLLKREFLQWQFRNSFN